MLQLQLTGSSMLQDRLLLYAALVAVGSGCFVLYFQHAGWIAGFCALATGVLAWIALHVELDGLLNYLPLSVHRKLDGSLFDLVSAVINFIAVVSCNLMRIIMLACFQLTEEQRMELLADMDPTFRKYFFQRTVMQLLPPPIQQLLVGRSSTGSSSGASSRSSSGKPARRKKAETGGTRSPGSAAAGSSQAMPPAAGPTPEEEDRGEQDGEEERESAPCTRIQPTLSSASMDSNAEDDLQLNVQRRSSTDSLLDIVRGIDAVARNSQNAMDVSKLERIITEKTLGKGFVTVGDVVNGVQTKAYNVYDSTRKTVETVCNDPRTQASASGAIGGAKTGCVAGAKTCGVIGGTIGGLVGIIPAVFTFGLSIPIGAAIGTVVGGATGAGVGTSAGAVGGGIWGFTHPEARVDTPEQPLSTPRGAPSALASPSQ